MKAIRIHSFGPSDQLRVEEISNPVPKENEILVRVRDIGVNPIDWKIREGYMKDVIPAHFPLTLGQDFAGEVVELGSNVQSFKVGDRVFGFAHGSYAEFARVSEEKVAKLPDRVDFVTAASIPTAGITAYQAIMQSIDLKEGQSILIHGAGGGVGSFAVQLALWKKAQIYVTASDVDFDFLKKQGVKNIIDYKNEKFEEKVKDLDAVLDLVGGETLNRSYQVLKPGGVLVTTVGPMDQRLAQEKNIKGIAFLAKQNSEDLRHIAELVEQGVLKPRINEVVPLEEAKKAQDDLQKGHSKGKIILEVRPS